MTARLRPLTGADVEQVRLWRDHDETRRGLRRPEPLTMERQQQWFSDVVCKPEASRHRFWAVEVTEPATLTATMLAADDRTWSGSKCGRFVAQVGLESIWRDTRAEIHLISDPAVRGKGIGKIALRLLLERGFDEYGLDRAFGTCYTSNPALGFWRKMLIELGGMEMQDDDWTETNCADGQEWPSRRFWFTAWSWREKMAKVAA